MVEVIGFGERHQRFDRDAGRHLFEGGKRQLILGTQFAGRKVERERQHGRFEAGAAVLVDDSSAALRACCAAVSAASGSVVRLVSIVN